MASLTEKSTTVEGVMWSHLGDLLLNGRDDPEIPLPLPFICMRPIFLEILSIVLFVFPFFVLLFLIPPPQKLTSLQKYIYQFYPTNHLFGLSFLFSHFIRRSHTTAFKASQIRAHKTALLFFKHIHDFQ